MVIGIYPRKSVYRDNSDSVQVQIKMCKEYAEIIFKGQELRFLVYDKDEGFSGKNTNRPSFKELMSDVQANLLDAVIVYKLDRISRNVREFSAMYEVFQQHNVAFISVKEAFDTSTPMGRTVMYILAAFAQLERENTSERVSDSMHALGMSGKWTGGRCPAGMVSVRHTVGSKEHSFLEVDKNAIGDVKLLYKLMLEGYTITRVERYCRDHGIQTRNGAFMCASKIHNILTNPVYCQDSIEAYEYFKSLGCSLPDPSLFDGKHGLIAYGRTKNTADTQKRQVSSTWAISIGIHAAVIPATDWIAVQSRLGINKMYHSAKYDIGLLKGVLHCSCGSRMDVRCYKKNGRFFSYYYCAVMARQGKKACPSEYTRVERIDDAFLSQLKTIRLNPDGFCLRLEQEDSFRAESAIKADLKQTQEAIDNLTSALAQSSGSTAISYIVSKIEEFDRHKSALEADLRRARAREKETLSIQEKEKIIYENICFLLDNFNEIGYSGKNELIRKIVKNAVFDGKKLSIIF